jgi:hypothetical protein
MLNNILNTTAPVVFCGDCGMIRIEAICAESDDNDEEAIWGEIDAQIAADEADCGE